PHQESLDTIRNGLDHYPGGLTEPHPHDQQALVNAVPHEPDGTPQRFPDPFGHWSQLQNDGGNQVPGRSNNCADCSRSFLETWYGNPQVSAPRTLDVDQHGNLDPWSPEHDANTNQIRWSGAAHTYAGTGSDPETPNRIASDLQQAGHGAAAIVQVDWPGGGGHAFNAVNHHGNIIWIDTQSGEVSHQPLHIPNAEHVWHIPLDANRNPLHPTPRPETGTSHHDSNNPQEGTGTPHPESDNSLHENNKTPDSENSSDEPSKKAPDENTPNSEAETTPHNPPRTESDNHSGEDPSHAEPGPTHADTPKTDGTSTRHPSDTTYEPDSGSPHTTDENKNRTEGDRLTSPAHDAVQPSHASTRTDVPHAPHAGDPTPEHQSPSATERPGNTDPTNVTDDTVPAPKHAATGDLATDQRTPTSGPHTAGTPHQQHTPAPRPTDPLKQDTSERKPPTDDQPGPRPNTTARPDRPAPAIPDNRNHRAPENPAGHGSTPDDADPTRAERNASLPLPERPDAEQLGLAPDDAQQAVRDYENPDLRGLPVHRIDLEPVHEGLRGWARDGRLASVLREAADRMDAVKQAREAGETDMPPTAFSRKFLEESLGDEFRQLNDGQRYAVVASLARLSLAYHESQGVGHNPEHDRDGRPYMDAEPRGDGDPDRATDSERAVSADARDRANNKFPSQYRSDQETKDNLKELHERLTGNSKRPTIEQINAIIDATGHKPDFSGKNYAVIEVVDSKGNSSYVVDSSVPADESGVSPRHSEKHLLDWFDRTNSAPEGKKYTLAGLYTEREPCGVGEGHADCSTRLRTHPDMRDGKVPVHYSTTYRTDPEGLELRQADRERLKDLQNKALAKMEDGLPKEEIERRLKKLGLHNSQISRKVGKIATDPESAMTEEMNDHLSVIGEVWAETMLHIIPPH
ncbi:toxin glutamine deamidase domain-containing protein, partial [Streptomyces sp. NPDC001215]